MSSNSITYIIDGCINANRQYQKELYRRYYALAYNICMRYCNVVDDTSELINDGFLKIFNSIHKFTPKYDNLEASLEGWIKSIMVHTAIDHFRKNKRNFLLKDLDDDDVAFSDGDVSVIDTMAYKELLELVQQLSPGYRAVFNLYVIDGYKHEEIANKLRISVGASKSNLAKARRSIRTMITDKKIQIYGLRAI